MNEEQDERLLKEYEADIAASQQAGMQQQIPYTAAMFAGQQKQNLVEWQLDFKPELVEIERLLRGDVLYRDKEGNEEWILPQREVLLRIELDFNNVKYYINEENYLIGIEFPNKRFLDYSNYNLKFVQKDGSKLMIDNDEELVPSDSKYKFIGYKAIKIVDKSRILFNDIGVQDTLRYIYSFVNKSKVLSNYDPEEIKQRVHLFKHEFRVLIYNNSERYGMDNEYKQNNYSMMVHAVGSLIEDAYRRAMNGEERRDLNSARMVNQNEPIMPNNINIYPQQQKRGIISRMMPWNWGKGGQ